MSLATALDTALDRSVALGYGNVGLSVRRRLPGWPADPPRMDGKVVLVTGAGSGLGQAAAQGFARLGASVRVLGRNDERAEDAARKVRLAVPEADVEPVACDVSGVAAIREFCERFVAAEDRLDVLVNNAGVMPSERERSADGVELTFATSVVGPWALIDGLRELMGRTGQARIVNVTSGGMYAQQVPEGDIESEQADYSPKQFYARAKRAQMLITEEWAERLAGTGVVIHAMHPGWADTEGVRQWMPVFRTATRPIMRTPEQGADTIVWLGGAPEPLRSSGALWQDRRQRPTTYRLGAGPDPATVRKAVWRRCEELAAGAEAASRAASGASAS